MRVKIYKYQNISLGMPSPKPNYRLVRSFNTPRFRRDRLVSDNTKSVAIDELLNARKNRTKTGNRSGRITGAVLGAYSVAHNVILENSDMRTGVARALVAAAAAAALGKGFGHANESRVANVTEQVGFALHEEVPHSPELKRFLGSWRYVYIDRKGNLVGTNVGRFLKVGRMRLETNKILAGMY